MSNPFANITPGGGGNGTFNIWRGEFQQDGELVYAEAAFSDYVVPPKGEYRLKVTGLGEPFEDEIPAQYRKRLPSGEIDPNGPATSTKTRLELTIVGGNHDGEKVLISYLTLSLSSGGKSGRPANLYVIFQAACPEGGTDPGDMLGRDFFAYLKPSDSKRDDGTPKYAVMSYDTCSPVEDAPESTPEENPFKKSA